MKNIMMNEPLTGNIVMNDGSVGNIDILSMESYISDHADPTLIIKGVLTNKTRVKTMLPELKCIVQDHKATVVHWTDGTYTSVVCGDDDTPNVYAAYCAAYQKKMLGSTSAVHKLVDSHLLSTMNAKRDEEARKNREEQEERQKRNYDRKVRDLAKKMKMERDALDLLYGEKNVND